MLNKLKKLQQQKSSEGFTIIEVMIVLAIAGLIILIVLLAVPALQRNGRNSAIKQDATALAGGISDFASNNNGAIPDRALFTTGALDLQTATITTGGTVKLQGSTSINGATTGSVNFATAMPVAADAVAGNLFVVTGESCKAVAATAPTKSKRAFAIYYWTEQTKVAAGADTTTGIINAVGLKGQCIDS